MSLIRGMAGNVQTWDPLAGMIDQLRLDGAARLRAMTHAECLALRAITRCDRDPGRAILLL